MSLRRKSCNACFRSRRKCDLAFPVCGYCGKTSKACEYAYPPTNTIPHQDNVEDPLQTASQLSMSHTASSESNFGTGWLMRRDQIEAAHLGPSFSPGLLGEMAPLAGFGRWVVVHEEMKDYPLQFAKQAETMFIHKTLLEEYQFPRALRAAFGICSASLTVTEKSRPLMFKAIDAEVKDLLATREKQRTLVDDLVTLQAAVLYQTIRLYQGSVEERMTAEQQEFLLRSYALTVLRRADVELSQAARTWEAWILAESIRRTVLVVFKLYTMYWAYRLGRCFEIEGLDVLPVSLAPELWRAEGKVFFEGHPNPNGVLTHEDFIKMWNGREPPGVDSFHDLLLLGCKRQLGENMEGWRE